MSSLPAVHMPDAQVIKSLDSLEVEAVVGNCGGVNQCKLVRCNDGKRYVLKMRTTARRSNSSANEALGSLLLSGLGFPTPKYRAVSITDRTLYYNSALLFRDEARGRPELGTHFASEYIDHCMMASFDDIPHSERSLLRQQGFLIGMCVFDLWASHADRRQFLVNNDSCRERDRIMFIDNEHLFGGPLWNHWRRLQTDSQLASLVQSGSSMRQLEDWIEFFQAMIPTLLQLAIPCIPATWCQHNPSHLEQRLLERLARLQSLVDARLCAQERFPFT